LVYQSKFVQDWWERKYGAVNNSSTVIYNGVDLDLYTFQGIEAPPEDRWRIILVEGSLMGGYEQGLEVAVLLAEKLTIYLPGIRKVHSSAGEVRFSDRQHEKIQKVELMVVGKAEEALRKECLSRLASDGCSSRVSLTWEGQVPGTRIPNLGRSSHFLYSADINAACPNSVIEALACGLPVLSFDTGALSELVSAGAGRVVPYGGDPWRLDPPDVDSLAEAAWEILGDQERFRKAARALAESKFSLESMVDSYLKVLLGQ